MVVFHDAGSFKKKKKKKNNEEEAEGSGVTVRWGHGRLARAMDLFFLLFLLDRNTKRVIAATGKMSTRRQANPGLPFRRDSRIEDGCPFAGARIVTGLRRLLFAWHHRSRSAITQILP